MIIRYRKSSCIHLFDQLNCCILILAVVLGFLSFSMAHASVLLLDISEENTTTKMVPDVIIEPLRPAIRYRVVEPNPALGDVAGLTKNQGLLLNLFEDVLLDARIESVDLNRMGTTTVRATLDKFPLGFLVATTSSNVMKVSVDVPEKNQRYLILHDQQLQKYQLLELDMEAIDYIGTCNQKMPTLDFSSSASSTKAGTEIDFPAHKSLTEDDPAVVAVMVVYTPAARSWAGDAPGQSTNINNTIAQAMSRANLTAVNSQIGLTFDLVHSAEVNYTESGDSTIDLDRLTFYEGFDPFDFEDGPPWFMDEIHEWRDTYCADLVVLLSRVSDVGGVAWLLTNEDGIPELGFSITRVQQAGTSFTMTHEMAHNMGSHHHKEQSSQPGPGLFPYSAGWRWVGSDGGRYASVMSYESGSFFSDGLSHNRVAHFSNPLVQHLGAPTGHVVNGDNARTLRKIKHVIAAYRTGCELPVEIMVPDIIDLSLAEAEILLTEAGLLVGTISLVFDDLIIEGNVVASNPQAGSVVLSGTPVDLTVSKGIESVIEEPDLSIISNIPADLIFINDTLELQAGEGGSNYSWLKDGMPIDADERISGVDSRILIIHGITLNDIGVYTCQFSYDGNFVESEPFVIVEISGVEFLPASSLLGVLLLISLMTFWGFRHRYKS